MIGPKVRGGVDASHSQTKAVVVGVALLGLTLLAGGAIALATLTGGPVVGAIICMAWGVLYCAVAIDRESR